VTIDIILCLRRDSYEGADCALRSDEPELLSNLINSLMNKNKFGVFAHGRRWLFTLKIILHSFKSQDLWLKLMGKLSHTRTEKCHTVWAKIIQLLNTSTTLANCLIKASIYKRSITSFSSKSPNKSQNLPILLSKEPKIPAKNGL